MCWPRGILNMDAFQKIHCSFCHSDLGRSSNRLGRAPISWKVFLKNPANQQCNYQVSGCGILHSGNPRSKFGTVARRKMRAAGGSETAPDAARFVPAPLRRGFSFPPLEIPSRQRFPRCHFARSSSGGARGITPPMCASCAIVARRAENFCVTFAPLVGTLSPARSRSCWRRSWSWGLCPEKPVSSRNAPALERKTCASGPGPREANKDAMDVKATTKLTSVSSDLTFITNRGSMRQW
jgi:hypothetical protein